MTDEKMVESLWSLANGITSFAVLQALAFLCALGREDFIRAITNRLAQLAIVSGTPSSVGDNFGLRSSSRLEDVRQRTLPDRGSAAERGPCP